MYGLDENKAMMEVKHRAHAHDRGGHERNRRQTLLRGGAAACILGGAELHADAARRSGELRLGYGGAAEEPLWLLIAKPELGKHYGTLYTLNAIKFQGSDKRAQAFEADAIDPLSTRSVPVGVTGRRSDIPGAHVRIIRLGQRRRGYDDSSQSHNSDKFLHVTSPSNVVCGASRIQIECLGARPCEAKLVIGCGAHRFRMRFRKLNSMLTSSDRCL